MCGPSEIMSILYESVKSNRVKDCAVVKHKQFYMTQILSYSGFT